MPDPESIYSFITKYVYPNISIISAIFAAIIILSMIFLSLYNFQLVNRVTLRLQTAIATYDLFMHTEPLWIKLVPKANTPPCTFIGWLSVFMTLMYTGLNVAIGVNLHRVFLKNLKTNYKVECLYWLVPIGISLLLTLPPLALGKFGYNEEMGCSYTKENAEFGKLYDFYAVQITRLLGMLYLGGVAILVFLKLYRGTIPVKTQINGEDIVEDKLQAELKLVKRIGYRILLYPIAMILTQTGLLSAQVYNDFYQDSISQLNSWAKMGVVVTGLFNFVAFCFDPSIQISIKILYNKISGSLSTEDNSNNNDKKAKDSKDSQENPLTDLIKVVADLVEKRNTNTESSMNTKEDLIRKVIDTYYNKETSKDETHSKNQNMEDKIESILDRLLGLKEDNDEIKKNKVTENYENRGKVKEEIDEVKVNNPLDTNPNSLTSEPIAVAPLKTGPSELLKSQVLITKKDSDPLSRLKEKPSENYQTQSLPITFKPIKTHIPSRDHMYATLNDISSIFKGKKILEQESTCEELSKASPKLESAHGIFIEDQIEESKVVNEENISRNNWGLSSLWKGMYRKLNSTVNYYKGKQQASSALVQEKENMNKSNLSSANIVEVEKGNVIQNAGEIDNDSKGENSASDVQKLLKLVRSL